MKTFFVKTDLLTGEEYLEVYLRGQQILTDPFLNKGSAFNEEERISLELDGLLRTEVSNLETQRERSYAMYNRKQDDLEKYIFLQGLQNRNETLFYSLLCDNLFEMLPIVYTPTVGKACLMLSHITREYRGVYINPDNIGSIDKIFQGISLPEVYLIVVTDGERILGLGDLGSDGMGIPVGKINLYVAAGGIHPACCLPISLDVGTNNQSLLDDPLYLGYRHKRLEGKEYDEFIERFVMGIKRVFPQALLQWEDFAKHKAFKLLERYHERILSFNDDIQGTGACALAALLSAMKIKKQRFNDQRFVIAGLGQAGSGIARNILNMLMEEGASIEEARSKIFAYDYLGLLMEDTPGIVEYQKPFAQKHDAIANWKLDSPSSVTLKDIVKNSKATVLIGVTATNGLFNHEILSQMGANDERPVIFALSNPTSKSECSPEEVAIATNGRGITATGSPFPPVEFNGKKLFSSQCNNMFIFPGVGLGALVSKATRITTKMFLQASRALSELVSEEQLNSNMLLPDIKDIRNVSFHIALAVAIEARDSGLGRMLSDEALSDLIKKAQWEPRYYPFRPGKQE
ncbi:MAG: NAD-dependent malic enzyme [Ignavibacteriaceae bacterium]|jgi:malate dehydrogenase (oxaloacetate-decarboxylating)